MMRRRGGSDVKLVPAQRDRVAREGRDRPRLVEGEGADVHRGGPRGARDAAAFFGGSRGTTTGADGKFELTSVPKGTAILMVPKTAGSSRASTARA